MAHKMSEEEIRTFLTASPAKPAIVATVRKDGRPHVAPIWYDVDDDGTIVFNTGKDSVKGRNLIRTGQAALSVQDDAEPYAYVTIEGTVAISEDLDEVKPWAGRIGGRYLGADQADTMAERNGVPGELLVRLTPTNTVAIADLTA